ncbi:hypothetical protein L195_g001445 [Trifolium pratense]|uniref:Uncharacterized protein n=1 Tax=Trifolium pratense TaxID=57577 RepID=A0A2K3NPP2_TRIPR|nr:hypothetical protein L195_g001445 [Trifolium pratense]
MHMVTDYFSHSEWKVIAEVLGPNPRHLFELYALKQNNYLQNTKVDGASTFEDIVDAYLAYLQRHPPRVDDPKLRMEWAKLQLMDFVQSLVIADFGVNYRIDYSEEIFDDPAAVALLQSLAGGAALCSTGSTLLSSHIYRNSEVSSKMACSAADAAHIPPLDSFSVAQNNTGTFLSPFDGLPWKVKMGGKSSTDFIESLSVPYIQDEMHFKWHIA